MTLGETVNGQCYATIDLYIYVTLYFLDIDNFFIIIAVLAITLEKFDEFWMNPFLADGLVVMGSVIQPNCK